MTNTQIMKFDLVFHHQSIQPTERGDYLLYNQCDGFHRAEAGFSDDGSFEYFYEWIPTGISTFEAEHYQAWAKLPDSLDLYDAFADKPTDTLSAYDVTMARLAKQEAGQPQE